MCEHCKGKEAKETTNENLKKLITIFGAIIVLISAIILQNKLLYLTAYTIAGYEIIFAAIKNIIHKNFFDENFLMSTATIGAICIEEYPEAVAVMVLYQIGEFLQDKAVEKSEKSIKTLLKITPEYANVEENGEITVKHPDEVKERDTIIIKAGERVPVDGEVLNGSANIDTSPITGENRLKNVSIGDKVTSGCINTDGVITVRAEKTYKNSTVSKIMELTKNAADKKSRTEMFITKFAKIYTPIVVFLALVIIIIPTALFKEPASIWIERGLTFLVISCPCAFVISVPLTFFSGLGRASKSGILIKGSNFIEQLAKASNAIFDKTGTLTKGTFKVTEIKAQNGYSENELKEIAVYAQYYSNHPISRAIKEIYKGSVDTSKISGYKENAGLGVTITLNGDEIKVGNNKLTGVTDEIKSTGSVVYITKNNNYIGYIVISDEIKENANETIQELKEIGIKTYMLSGDTKQNACYIADKVNIDNYYAELLPQDKVERTENIMAKSKGTTIFTGDGINDAPVLMRSDIGIAMGVLGSDAAIEAADIVISDDNLTKIPMAIKISKKTLLIAKQNIIFALIVKMIFLSLGAAGLMIMWGAVFADVGVTLIAVLNSLKTLKMK